MAREPAEATEQETHLIDVITQYLEDQGAGRAPDRQGLLAQHPDLAEELMDFFAAEDQVVRTAAPLRAVAQAAALTPDSAADTLPSAIQKQPADPVVVRMLEALGFD